MVSLMEFNRSFLRDERLRLVPAAQLSHPSGVEDRGSPRGFSRVDAGSRAPATVNGSAAPLILMKGWDGLNRGSCFDEL